MDIDPRGKKFARDVLDAVYLKNAEGKEVLVPKDDIEQFKAENEKKRSYRQSDNTDNADITDKSGEVNRQTRQNRQTRNIGNYPEYLSRLSKTDKLKAYYLSNSEGLTDKEAANLVYGSEEDWKKVADLRANLSSEVVQCSDTRPARFKLTLDAETVALREFNNYLLDLQRSAEEAAEKDKAVELIDRWRSYVHTELEGGSLLDRAKAARDTRGLRTFCIDWAELILLQPDLASAMEEDVQRQVKNFQAILNGETGESWGVVINGFDDRSKIARLRAADYGRLINLHCEVASIGELYDRSLVRKYECPSCAMLVPVALNLEQKKAAEPQRCPGCKRKGRLRLLDETVVTAQAITLQEITELLQPGEQPRRLPAILLESLAEENAERFSIGNKITVTGCYIRQREDGKAEYARIFLIYGAGPVDDAILYAPASPEVMAEVAAIRSSSDPLGLLAEKIYGRVVGNDLAKRFCVLQGFGNIHLLLMGVPGTGKTELGKGTVNAFPRSAFIQSSNASRAGLTAAASKDEHTGRFVIESNALVRLNPHGIAVIDELDKSKEDVQYALLGVMQDRALTINKTNVQANLPCDVNILATANPKGDEFSNNHQLWEQANMVRPLYDRFSFVILFNSDLGKIKSFKEFFKRRILKTSGLSTHDRVVVRELVKQSWSVQPVTDDDDTLDKLDQLMREVIVPYPLVFGKSLRPTEVLPALLEALCRITGDSKPREFHFQQATDLLIKLRHHNTQALDAHSSSSQEKYGVCGECKERKGLAWVIGLGYVCESCSTGGQSRMVQR